MGINIFLNHKQIEIMQEHKYFFHFKLITLFFLHTWNMDMAKKQLLPTITANSNFYMKRIAGVSYEKKKAQMFDKQCAHFTGQWRTLV